MLIFFEIDDFVGMMAEWRWHLTMQDGGVIDIEFTGEKYGDDRIMFAAIAPFVEKGSYINMRGECGELITWSFDGKSFKEEDSRDDF